jgi:hypothetical protein
MGEAEKGCHRGKQARRVTGLRKSNRFNTEGVTLGVALHSGLFGVSQA